MNDKYIEAYNQGKTLKDIAQDFNISITSVWTYLKLQGLALRPRGDRRLFDLQRAITYRDKGYSYRRIARILGVNHSGIHRKIARANKN